MLRRRFLQLAGALVTAPAVMGAHHKKRGRAHTRAVTDTMSMRQTYATVDRFPVEG